MLFLGEFAKLRKVTITFVMSVCPSIRLSVQVEQLGFQETDVLEILILSLFRISVEKIQVSLISDKKTVTSYAD